MVKQSKVSIHLAQKIITDLSVGFKITETAKEVISMAHEKCTKRHRQLSLSR
jgi:hypothetical protein